MNPFVLAVLTEKHIDSESLRTKPVTDFKGRAFDYVIVLGDGDELLEPQLLPARLGQFASTFADPAQTHGSDLDVILAFRRTVLELSMRLSLLIIIVEGPDSARERLLAA